MADIKKINANGTSYDIATTWGKVKGTLSNQTDLSQALADKANTGDIKDSTITFKQGTATKGTITLNQANAATITLDPGGDPITYEETDKKLVLTQGGVSVGTGGVSVQDTVIANSAFEIADSDGNVAFQIDNAGNIKTKNFDSTAITPSPTAGVSSFGGATGAITLDIPYEVIGNKFYNLGHKGFVNPVISSSFALSSHRGSVDKTNNTIEAFEQAYTTKFKIVEGDLRYTSDGHIVFFHDESIGGKAISAYTLSELQSAYTYIPTLEKVLRWARLRDMCIELDCAGRLTEAYMQQVYNTISTYNMLSNVMITAYDNELNWLLNHNLTSISVCVSFLNRTVTEELIRNISKVFKRFNCTAISINKSLITNTTLPAVCHELHYVCKTWTVTTQAEAQTLFNYGVDMINVDATSYWQLDY